MWWTSWAPKPSKWIVVFVVFIESARQIVIVIIITVILIIVVLIVRLYIIVLVGICFGFDLFVLLLRLSWCGWCCRSRSC